MKRHPGDYLAKRMGRGRQCWSWCDRTPCRCPRPVRRSVRRAERQRVRVEIAGAMTGFVHDDSLDDWDVGTDYCSGCDWCDPSRAFWAAWREAQEESGRIERSVISFGTR